MASSSETIRSLLFGAANESASGSVNQSQLQALFQRDLRNVEALVQESKRNPFIWTDFNAITPNWNIVGWESFANEGFKRNPVAYAAIMFKIKELSQAPMRGYTGDLDLPTRLKYDHPLMRLLMRPNEYFSDVEFMAYNLMFLNITGNSFIYLDRAKPTELPRAMYPLNPSRVSIVPGADEDFGLTIKGYKYIPRNRQEKDAVPILPFQMIHTKLPNPLDPLEGMGFGLSPFESLAQSGDVDNAVTKFLKVLFDNGTLIGNALKFQQALDDRVVDKIKARWKEMYGGSEKWATEIAVLDSGAEYQRMTPTFEELGFSSIDERNESRITMPFGVSPILIGTRLGMIRGTLNNYEQARKSLWEDTLQFEIRLFESEFQYYLSNDNAFVKFDLSKVAALQKNVAAMTDSAHKLWSMGVPANIAFATVGLEVPQIDGGDIGYLPFGVVPVGAPSPAQPVPVAATIETTVEDNAPEGVNKHLTASSKKKDNEAVGDELKAAYYEKANETADQYEDDFRENAVDEFNAEMRMVLAAVTEAKSYSLSRKASFDWQRLQLDVGLYFGNGEADQAWRTRFAPLLQGVMQDTGTNMIAQFGLAFNVPNIGALQWFDEYTLVFAQKINQTTISGLTSVFQQGELEGWSIATTEKRIKELFDQWIKGDGTKDDFEWYNQRMPAHRIETIARTETMRGSNYGAFKLMKDWGVQKKEWLATGDSRTRPTHMDAWATYSGKGAIPIDQYFKVGGQSLMQPGDSNGGGEAINCRCTTIPVVELS